MTSREANDRATRILVVVSGWMEGREHDTKLRDELLRGKVREVARELGDPAAFAVIRAINKKL